MAARLDAKLNRLQHELPEGFVVDAAWLSRHGFSSSLRSHYVASGWLESPARRVYSRSRIPLTWERVVLSLQTLLNYSLVVGGRTALEEQGHGHYLSRDVREVHLYGPHRPPSWLKDIKLDVTFHYHNSLRLFPPSHDSDQVAAPGGNLPFATSSGFMIGPDGCLVRPLALSSSERAVLELMDELPNRESFHQVDMLMEGLANLSPNRLQTLLTGCRSVKVRRLFFFFADRHRHAWLKHIDQSTIDLGSGNRALIKGGVLDRRYHITVPGDLNGVS